MLPQFNDRAASRMFFIGMGLIAGSICCWIPASILLLRNWLLVGFGVFMILAGIGVFGYMAVNGLMMTKKAARTTESTVFEESKIIARFAMNELGETIFAEEYVDHEDPNTRLYIRLGTPDGRRWELKTSRPVWEQCGEGMRGKSTIQGDWLAGFVPIIGNP